MSGSDVRRAFRGWSEEPLHTSDYLTMMISFGNNRIHMIFVATPLAIHLSHILASLSLVLSCIH